MEEAKWVDLQINGYGGIDFNTVGLTVEQVRAVTQRLAADGTAHYLPTLVTGNPETVLANIRSVSMAEMTSMGATLVENAKLVGTRTWGGLCGLIGNEDYSFTYAGHIGVSGKTPVYVYCPCLAAFSRDGKILEGVGVTPDIEVHLDLGAWKSGNGPDSQLDRALQYITSGK